MRWAWIIIGLWWAAQGKLLGGDLAYAVVPIPAGSMSLEVPLNTFLNTDFLSTPVVIPAGLSIGKFEVSRALWQRCHEAGGCQKAALPTIGSGGDLPMVQIDWFEARAFALWFSKATGRRWRLPTEQEWFYVMSEGKGWRSEEREYDYSDLEAVRATPKRIYPRGHFGKNAWGVADLLGNVWEWTLSCYTLAPDRLLAKVDIRRLMDPDCCTTRVTGGEHRAEVPDFVDDTYNGGCSALKPAANLGLRLVLEP